MSLAATSLDLSNHDGDAVFLVSGPVLHLALPGAVDDGIPSCPGFVTLVTPDLFVSIRFSGMFKLCKKYHNYLKKENI